MLAAADAGRARLRIGLGLALASALVAAAWAFLRWNSGTAAGPGDWARRIPRASAGRPNVILAIYDARRRDDFSLGAGGSRRGDTPFLAEFARDALVFEQAVAPGCWTVPSHASMFTGLPVCELGIDYYNPGFQSLPQQVPALAEVLAAAGYRTVAFADHPFFHNANPGASLLRGFQRFSVITDFKTFPALSNLGAGPETRSEPLFAGLGWPTRDELAARLRELDAAGRHVDPLREADLDPATGLYLARLSALYRESEYFRRRYLPDLETLLAEKDGPFFLFLNIHMCCTGALPDPALYSRWLLETLLLNARARGERLVIEGGRDDVQALLKAAAGRLGAPPKGFPDTEAYLRHSFDTRFYDATFQALWEQVAAHGLEAETAAFVTSDHGLALREKGEHLYAHNGARPYEYMVRVPLVVRLPPGHDAAGLAGPRAETVSLTDLFATIGELALGADVLRRALPVGGHSLLERVRSGRFDPVVVSECSLLPIAYEDRPRLIGYARAAWRDGLKLLSVNSPVELSDAGAWPLDGRLDRRPGLFGLSRVSYQRPPLTLQRLYELGSDPLERRDLSAERSALLASIEAALPAGCSPGSGADQRSSWQGDSLETLKSLGYVQ